VVDDDPLTRFLIGSTLEQDGFIVEEAESGEIALSIFITQPFGMVLLDVLMPGIDGFTTCARLRELPIAMGVPIVMITALEDETSIRRAYSTGATDFITKPLNTFILAHRVRYILRASAAMRELSWRADFQRVLIETLPVPLAVEDSDGHCLIVNPAFRALKRTVPTRLGEDAPKSLGCDVPKPLAPSAVRAGEDAWQQRIYEAEMSAPGQETKSVIVHQAMFTPPTTGKTGLISVLVDITERKKNEENLRLADTVFQTAADAIVVTNANGVIMSVNPAFSIITGYSANEVIGQTPRFLVSKDPEHELPSGFWKNLQQTGWWSGEVWYCRKGGEDFPVWETITAVRSPEGQILEYVTFFNDITARKQAEAEIFYRANYDLLTGLPNRSLFQERLEQALKQARRYDRQVALMFADLDRFKQVNDTLGHSLGDRLLYQTAVRLGDCVRDTDTVARLGGDEFVVVLPNVIEEHDAAIVAEKIIGRLVEPFDLSGNIVHIGASIGIALYPGHGENSEDLVRHADLAMYQAKLSGRSTYRVYEPMMDDNLTQQLMLETDLRLALERGGLSLHFQPIVEVSTGRVVRAEGLLRWHHPQRGSVAPSQFIALAEETGLIRDLSIWVFEQACRTLQEWRQLGLTIPLAINLTSPQIFRGLTLEMMTATLNRYQASPKTLVFEIAEGMLLVDSPQSRRWLEDVRQFGIELDLDDFGTGYSSLSCLKRFPIDRVKIDLSFVRDMGVDANDKALVEGILALSRSLKLEVVAEGVETEEQLALLRDMGCDYVQGYLLSPPVPADEFITVVRELGTVQD
jgi:diguanylate cyclase (GGDEF)-like protein/PAS domain S-box-containing protein